jgi:hypothetical protein
LQKTKAISMGKKPLEIALSVSSSSQRAASSLPVENQPIGKAIPVNPPNFKQ